MILKNEDDDYPPKNKYRIWLYCSGHDNDGLHLATSWANVLKDSFKGIFNNYLITRKPEFKGHSRINGNEFIFGKYYQTQY